jgi:hypothetical protein
MPAVDANQQLMFPLTRPAVISLCTDSGFILKGCSQNRQFPPPGSATRKKLREYDAKPSPAPKLELQD